MSLAADLAAVLDGVKDPDQPWVYQVYDEWDAWLAAARPLLLDRRESYVHHDEAGNETESLEQTPDLVKARLWTGDCVGTVAFVKVLNLPVKALIHRKVDDETIELVWRHGPSVHNSMWRQLWWDLGFRKATYLGKPRQHKRWEKYFDEPDEAGIDIKPEHDNQRATIRWKRRPRRRQYGSDPQG